MNTALIVAAGVGARSGLKQSKILFKVNEKPIFMYSVEMFLSLGFEVVLVVSVNDHDEIKTYIDENVTLVVGGKTRAESVLNGLKLVKTPYVYIHDAARPLIQKEQILQLSKALELKDAACLFEKVTQALKYYDGKHIETRNRELHLLAQTPQAFLTEKIRYASLRNHETFDDDISLYQHFYKDDDIGIIINEHENPKLTYYDDFLYFKQRIEGNDMRIGHSFDLHQLVEDRPLILAGINIPYEKGLLGHSDADVVCHAIAEALLGSLALGDLGTHFPDDDKKYKDMDSTDILKQVYLMVNNKGYQLVNLDVMVYAEMPKLNPYIDKMRNKISKLLNVHIDLISIKATTYEKLDAIGKGLAIASEATLLVKKV
jgi:2-C-methyl-D-erythritol 4-phosphate cytidylyltransferase/2-C-methyl-D-erythritol 4-phosphate cytidylyltransferase/2-C-methyl-D-erythritol 2,4-cyclodiphosphate synthase